MFDLDRMGFLDKLDQILPLPMAAKLGALAGIVAAIIAGYVFLGWIPLQDEISVAQSQLEQEEIKYRKNMRLAKDLPKKKQEYAMLQKQLRIALAMLPKRSQIPELLEQVSWAGKNAGLEFSEFKPMGERPKQIYAEVPVSLRMTGSFRQLMDFLRRVGELPRIVNVRGLRMELREGTLAISGEAVTYRFLEQKKKKRRRRRR